LEDLDDLFLKKELNEIIPPSPLSQQSHILTPLEIKVNSCKQSFDIEV